MSLLPKHKTTLAVGMLQGHLKVSYLGTIQGDLSRQSQIFSINFPQVLADAADFIVHQPKIITVFKEKHIHTERETLKSLAFYIRVF